MTDLPLFDFQAEIRSKFKRRITERTAVIAINKWLAPEQRIKRPVGFLCSNKPDLGCWVLPFKGLDGHVYLFGDSYGFKDGLRDLLTDMNLQEHTSFYQWKDAECFNDMGDGCPLSIHRPFVFVTKVPIKTIDAEV